MPIVEIQERQDFKCSKRPHPNIFSWWGSRATPHKSAGINISTAGRSNSAYPVLPGLVTRAHSPYGGSPKSVYGGSGKTGTSSSDNSRCNVDRLFLRTSVRHPLYCLSDSFTRHAAAKRARTLPLGGPPSRTSASNSSKPRNIPDNIPEYMPL